MAGRSKLVSCLLSSEGGDKGSDRVGMLDSILCFVAQFGELSAIGVGSNVNWLVCVTSDFRQSEYGADDPRGVLTDAISKCCRVTGKTGIRLYEIHVLGTVKA